MKVRSRSAAMVNVYELPPMRPPSEAHSLLVRIMRGCPWNRCTFCDVYKPMKFDKRSIRSVADVKGDIDTAKKIADRALEVSWMLGYGGKMTQAVRRHMATSYGIDIAAFPWLVRDGYPRTAFLADSNAIVIKVDALVEMVEYLRQTFVSVHRVTSYGRAKTIVMKKPEDLERLRASGLTRLHLGLETGDDELLKLVRKGATADQMIEAGKKVKEAGFELSEYVMPGLGGRSRMEQHARNTATVLNAIDPHFTRMRSFVPRPGTPLYEEYQRGEFQLTSPHERLREIRIMVEGLDISGRVAFDHFMNPSYLELGSLVHVFRLDEEGYKFPEEKEEVLEQTDRALRMDESRFLHARKLIASEHL